MTNSVTSKKSQKYKCCESLDVDPISVCAHSLLFDKMNGAYVLELALVAACAVAVSEAAGPAPLDASSAAEYAPPVFPSPELLPPLFRRADGATAAAAGFSPEKDQGVNRTQISEMTTDSIKHWSVALNHVTRPCRREVAHAFVAADVAFPSVTRPVIFKASGTCNGEIFEALRKYFYYGKQTPRAAEHNTVEMDYPDLSFFEQLYGETGGHLNNIKSDDKGVLSDVEWKETLFNILYEVTELIPNECREETGLLFDVAVGESLDIGFVDGKKNFKITEKCSEYSYSALEIFFTSLRSLEAFAFKEDLVEKSKLLQLIDEWKQSKESPQAPQEPSEVPDQKLHRVILGPHESPALPPDTILGQENPSDLLPLEEKRFESLSGTPPVDLDA